MSNIKVILYKQKTLKNGLHPVMLYVYEGKVRRLSLGYFCSVADWDFKTGSFRKNYPNSKTKNLNLRKFEFKANEIVDDFIRKGERFSYDKFKQLFKGEKTDKKLFYAFFQERIAEKEKLGKASTFLSYLDALRAIKKYHAADFNFEELTYTFLKGFETFLFTPGCTGGGIACRIRVIKAVYYEATRRGYVDAEHNPFNTSPSD